MSNIHAKIKAVLARYPTLNYFGFGLYEQRRYSSSEQKALIEKGQQELLDKADEVKFVVEWLSDVVKTKSTNPSCNSYRLKHQSEKAFLPKKYLSNGAFITGALIAGFTAKQTGPNASFNMSKLSLRKKKNT